MAGPREPATWRAVLAFVLDLFFSFFVFGYIIAAITGDRTDGGFSLSGLPAVILLGLVVAYMALMPRFGGRVFQRLLNAD